VTANRKRNPWFLKKCNWNQFACVTSSVALPILSYLREQVLPWILTLFRILIIAKFSDLLLKNSLNPGFQNRNKEKTLHQHPINGHGSRGHGKSRARPNLSKLAFSQKFCWTLMKRQSHVDFTAAKSNKGDELSPPAETFHKMVELFPLFSRSVLFWPVYYNLILGI